MLPLVRSNSMPTMNNGILELNNSLKTTRENNNQGLKSSGRSISTTERPFSLWNKVCAFFARCFPCVNRNRKVDVLQGEKDDFKHIIQKQDQYINRNLDRIFKVEKRIDKLELNNHKPAITLEKIDTVPVVVAPTSSVDASTQTEAYQRKRDVSNSSTSTTASDSGDDTLASNNSAIVPFNHRNSNSGMPMGEGVDPEKEQPLAIEAGPQQLAIKAGPQQLAIKAGPQQLAIKAGPQQLAIKAGPQQLAIKAGPQQLAIKAGPQQLAIEAGSRQLALEAGPQQLAIKAGPQQLAIKAGPQQLAIKAGPQQLAIKAGPRQLAIKAGPQQLAIKAGPQQLAIKAGPQQLAIKAGPQQLAIKAGPQQLAIKAGPQQLAIKAGPQQLAIEAGSRQLAIEAGPQQLALEAGPRQLAGNDSAIVPFNRRLAITAGLQPLAITAGEQPLVTVSSNANRLLHIIDSIPQIDTSRLTNQPSWGLGDSPYTRNHSDMIAQLKALGEQRAQQDWGVPTAVQPPLLAIENGAFSSENGSINPPTITQLPGSPWDLVHATGMEQRVGALGGKAVPLTEKPKSLAEKLAIAQAAAKQIIADPNATHEMRETAKAKVIQANRELKVNGKIIKSRRRRGRNKSMAPSITAGSRKLAASVPVKKNIN